MAGIIMDQHKIIESIDGEQARQCIGLVIAMFEKQQAGLSQVSRRFLNEPAIEIEPVHATVECQVRFMVPDVRHQFLQDRLDDIRRIRCNDIKNRTRCRP